DRRTGWCGKGRAYGWMDGWMGLRVLFHGPENHTSMERRLFFGGVLYALGGGGDGFGGFSLQISVCVLLCRLGRIGGPLSPTGVFSPSVYSTSSLYIDRRTN